MRLPPQSEGGYSHEFKMVVLIIGVLFALAIGVIDDPFGWF